MNSSTISVTHFEVDRANWQKTRIHEDTLSTDLAEHEVILSVEHFALTTNNITYAVSGDALGYWRFFPSSEGWGRIPAMGYADVVKSNAEGIEVGERVWGWFPMSSHLKVKAGGVSPFGFKDVSEHRAGLAPIYAYFERTSANPFYQRSEEALDMLLRGLFTTSWLVEDFMADNDFFAAEQFLITSASSKTSMALAFAVKERGKCRAIGLTSAGNKAFVEGLGLYDEVHTYDQLEGLNAQSAAILVDMAGSTTLREGLHHQFKDYLVQSCLIGATHHDDFGGASQELPGAKPTFFFAPTQAQKRLQDWGPGELEKRVAKSLQAFKQVSDKILTVVNYSGTDAMSEHYQRMLSGEASPSEGIVLTLKQA